MSISTKLGIIHYQDALVCTAYKRFNSFSTLFITCKAPSSGYEGINRQKCNISMKPSDKRRNRRTNELKLFPAEGASRTVYGYPFSLTKFFNNC